MHHPIIKHCLRHPHTSDKSARKCYAKNVTKRADRRLERSGSTHKMPKYRQVKYYPPDPQPIFKRNAEGKITKVIMVMYFYKGIADGFK